MPLEGSLFIPNGPFCAHFHVVDPTGSEMWFPPTDASPALGEHSKKHPSSTIGTDGWLNHHADIACRSAPPSPLYRPVDADRQAPA